MKIIVVLFLLFSNSELLAAEDKITLRMESYPLKEILYAIEQHSSYFFIYNEYLVDDEQIFTLSVKEMTIEKALEKLFANTTITYMIRYPHIVLKDTSKDSSTKTLKTTVLEGKVFDAQTAEALVGTTVVIDPKTYAITDKDGYYKLINPKKISQITISHLGYQEQHKIFNAASKKQQNFYLNNKTSKLDEVEVKAPSNHYSQVGRFETVSTLKGKEISNPSSYLGVADINAEIRRIPGVNSNGIGTSGFTVRGGNKDQNRILFEGAPIYEADHLFGLFSIFNPSVIKNVNLYKGNIPAHLGGGAAAILEMRLNGGNKDKIRIDGSLGPMTANLQVEGPLAKEKAGFLVAFRSTHLDILKRLNAKSDTSNFSFHDLTTKVDYNINKKHSLYWTTFFAIDTYETKFSQSNLPSQYNLKQLITTLGWNYYLSKKSTINLSTFFSQHHLNLKIYEGIPFNELMGNLKFNTDNKTVGSKISLTHHSGKNSIFKLGHELLNQTVTPINIFDFQLQVLETLTSKNHVLENSLFAEWEKKWQNFSFNVGVRWNHFYNPKTNNTALVNTLWGRKTEPQNKIRSNFEPRLALNLILNENTSLNANYNRMFQYVHRITNTTLLFPINIWKPSDHNISPIAVNQWALGISNETVLQDLKWNFHLEAYYKTLNNMLNYDNTMSLPMDQSLINDFLTENGFAYGFELNNNIQFKKWTLNLNYTFSRSFRNLVSDTENKFIAFKNPYYPADYDIPHVLNLGVDHWLSDRLKMNVFFTYQSGRPTSLSPENLFFSAKTPFSILNRNGYRLAPTHRMDFAFNYYEKNKSSKKWHGYWTFGMYNAYGQKNTIAAFWGIDPNNPNQIKQFQLSIFDQMIPFVSYHFNF